MKLILASASARRRDLFRMIDFDYEVTVSHADENIPNCAPVEFVKQLALLKASSVRKENNLAGKDCCVIGCDTIVALDGKIIGKPKDPADAHNILRTLSGRTHIVYTGVAILTDNAEIIFADDAHVTFATLTDAEIDSYVATGEPLDKAGAYGVQGPASVFVERIDGCYFTVMGLPVPKLYKELSALGIKPKWLQK